MNFTSRSIPWFLVLRTYLERIHGDTAAVDPVEGHQSRVCEADPEENGQGEREAHGQTAGQAQSWHPGHHIRLRVSASPG